MDTLKTNDNSIKVTRFNYLNFPYPHHSKPHCPKCGRRTRNHNNNLIQHSSHYDNGLVQSNHNHNHIRKDSKINVLIDQLIQVQQVDNFQCNHILSYREYYFPREYIILKRLEEKNNFINQNRCNVDHQLRSFQLQYQTMSILLQTTTITSFIYSKLDSYHQRPIVNKLNQSLSRNERSVSTTAERNLIKSPEILTSTEPSVSLTLLTSSNELKQQQLQQQQYSQNATESYISSDYPTNSYYDTAVIVDVRKCSRMSTSKTNLIYPPIIQNNGNIPDSDTFQQALSSVYPSTNQPIYYDQHPQTIFLSWPYNLSHTPHQQISTNFHYCNPVINYNESVLNISQETTRFSRSTNFSVSVHQFTESQKLLSYTDGEQPQIFLLFI
ncbi:hypothetical protein I4U23_028994 [Adineta vaga]|nr:hypothetical protein I4U23_028994 [Adineta vaga]